MMVDTRRCPRRMLAQKEGVGDWISPGIVWPLCLRRRDAKYGAE